MLVYKMYSYSTVHKGLYTGIKFSPSSSLGIPILELVLCTAYRSFSNLTFHVTLSFSPFISAYRSFLVLLYKLG